jgi:hypothetical protein
MKMQTWRRILTLLLPFLLAGLFASVVYADEGDPPGRVARLSLAQGKVSFQPSGETDWSEASVNRPVTTGDRLYTDQDARAELEVGSFAVRLGQGTDLTLANLNYQIMQLGVGQGTLRVTVYEMPENNSVEIDTPNGALILQTAGSYRVDTAADGNSTQVTVNAGSLEISAGDLSQTLQSGQAVQLTGTGPVAASSLSVPRPDDFDKWCAGRDRRIENSPSVKSVGPAVPGDEDLDTYGQWTTEPEYGPVWVPANVPPGWVPYRNGYWAFIEPWGWTWVEAEPWGYAPFHYGRWAHIGPVWAWVPGPVVVAPVYAPALVAFVGGPGFGMGMGVGVAWFPLGPREPFLPWYHYGPNYIRAFNVVSATNISTFHYVNREVAVTAVSGDVFRSGQPVARGMLHMTPEQLAHAEVIPHPEVSPTARAVFGARTVAAPPVPAARFGAPRPASPGEPSGPQTPAPVTREAERTGGPPNTPSPHMFTRNAPAPGNAPFAARQEAYSSHPGRPLEPQQMDNLRAGKPAGPMQDKEAIPHPSKGNTKTSPSHDEHGHH